MDDLEIEEEDASVKAFFASRGAPSSSLSVPIGTIDFVAQGELAKFTVVCAHYYIEITF